MACFFSDCHLTGKKIYTLLMPVIIQKAVKIYEAPTTDFRFILSMPSEKFLRILCDFYQIKPMLAIAAKYLSGSAEKVAAKGQMVYIFEKEECFKTLKAIL